MEKNATENNKFTNLIKKISWGKDSEKREGKVLHKEIKNEVKGEQSVTEILITRDVKQNGT